MSDNKQASKVLAFLSGEGENPLPESKRGLAGPLEKAFVDGVEREIQEQDKLAETGTAPKKEGGRL